MEAFVTPADRTATFRILFLAISVDVFFAKGCVTMSGGGRSYLLWFLGALVAWACIVPASKGYKP